MTRRKANLAQTEIPTGNEIGRKHDPDEEYERVFGEPAAARERLRYVEGPPLHLRLGLP